VVSGPGDYMGFISPGSGRMGSFPGTLLTSAEGEKVSWG